jgi:hypothetical protein
MAWICPKCERELSKANQWHQCIRVSMDSLFEGKAPELVFVFDALLTEIMDWNEVGVSATQNCIVFVHHQTFFVIRPMKKQLDLKFYSTTVLDELPVIKSILYAGKYENHIRVGNLDDLTEEVFEYINASYKMF